MINWIEIKEDLSNLPATEDKCYLWGKTAIDFVFQGFMSSNKFIESSCGEFVEITEVTHYAEINYPEVKK